MYASGGFVKFHIADGRMYFNDRIRRVNILYKEFVRDENGLPMLSDKEARAIAAYVAYIYYNKQALINMNKDIMGMA